MQKRGAPHLHAYLSVVDPVVAGGFDGDRFLNGWLTDPRVAATGALPIGQHVERMRSEDAAISYMVAEASKLHQRQGGWQGRRWGKIDGPAVKSTSVESVDLDFVPLWASWKQLATMRPRKAAWSPMAWVRACAGVVPRWWAVPLWHWTEALGVRRRETLRPVPVRWDRRGFWLQPAEDAHGGAFHHRVLLSVNDKLDMWDDSGRSVRDT